jgi:NAD+ synthase
MKRAGFALPGLDCEREAARIAKALSVFLGKSKRPCAVIGVSGGVDSALCAALCCRALGKKRVVALVLPSASTPARDLRDARSIAKRYAGKVFEMDIGGIAAQCEKAVSAHAPVSRLEAGNIAARTRMMLLYHFARRLDGIVIGTGDASELAIGYFTKYGDGGCDVLPIGSIYKTHVREMARFLGVPKRVAEKPASPQLWRGHSAEAELGMGYGEIDAALFLLSKARRKDAERLVGKRKLALILSMKEKSRHKRQMPPII